MAPLDMRGRWRPVVGGGAARLGRHGGVARAPIGATCSSVVAAGAAAGAAHRPASMADGRACLASCSCCAAVGDTLAVTGGMAAGYSLVQQVLGHGIAAKLSQRLGEACSTAC